MPSLQPPRREETPGQKIGGAILGLSIVFCGMEMIPGWGMLHLSWPRSVFFGIMAVTGAVSGLLIAERHRLPGLIGGLVGGPCALVAIAWLLEHTTRTHTALVVLAGLIGGLPGLGLYALLAAIENAIRHPRAGARPGNGS